MLLWSLFSSIFLRLYFLLMVYLVFDWKTEQNYTQSDACWYVSGIFWHVFFLVFSNPCPFWYKLVWADIAGIGTDMMTTLLYNADMGMSYKYYCWLLGTDYLAHELKFNTNWYEVLTASWWYVPIICDGMLWVDDESGFL
jgi:hypothetical protein